MKYYGLDIETDDPELKERGVSWVFGKGEILVTGLYNAETKEKKVFNGNGGASIKKLLINENVTLIGARIIYDLGWLCHSFGLKAHDVKCALVDVQLAEACIDEYQKFGLDDLAMKYLRERKGAEALASWATANGLSGDFRKHLKIAMYGRPAAGALKKIAAVPDLVKEYVMSDADQPVRIWEKQQVLIEQLKIQAPVQRKFKLIKVVLGMKQRGIRVDVKKKAENYVILKKVQDRLNDEFVSKYGKINFNSPKQLSELFDREKVPYRNKIRIKRLKSNPQDFEGEDLWEQKKKLKLLFAGVRVSKGQLIIYVSRQYASRTASELEDMGYVVTSNPNIDKKALEVLRKTHDVARCIVDLKQVTSIIDKFMGPNFDRFIVNGRIYCDFNIAGARQTGRFSSAMPNLQQVPSKAKLFRKTPDEIDLAKMCREVLIPDEGMWLCKMDYSGQESVIQAHFAVGPGSKEIRAKYNANPKFDFHRYMGDATGLYEEYGEEVGRKYTKNCAFGLGYGMQINTMMENFGWSKEQAEHITEVYNDAAPFVRPTMDAVSEIIVGRGYIVTLGGKHLHLQKFKRMYNGRLQYLVDKRSAYKGYNKLIQGSAADLMEEALVKIYDAGLDEVFPLYLTVHDEIDIGVPMTKEALKRLPELEEIMEHALPMVVPIRVDPELGNNWGNLHKFEENKAKFMRRAS